MKCQNIAYSIIKFWFFSDTERFHKSVLYDHTYSKYLVIWIQSLHADYISRYLPIVVHFLEICFLIQIDNDEKKILMCSKCLKLHLSVNSINLNASQFRIRREYKHKTYIVLKPDLQEKIQSKSSWCTSCMQVPLFQIADYNLCESIVGSTAHNCAEHYPIDESSDEFIYCTNCYGSGTMTNFSFKQEVDLSTF